MIKGITVLLAFAVVVGTAQVARAQTLNDADHVIIRLRAVCNQGQGGALVISFEARSRASGANNVGGFSDVITYNNAKMQLQSTQPRYNTSGAWYGAPYFRDIAFGSSAWYNQNGPPGGSMPMNTQYFTAAKDCGGNPLNDGFYEIMRYNFQIGVSANGTVNFGLYDVLPYKSGQQFQAGNTNTAIFYSGAQNNGNDSTLVINNLLIPVELADFSASALDNGGVLLTWKTASESSNIGFEIQRRNGEDFEKIGFVPGAGTTLSEQSYSFTDANPFAPDGMAYYRLKQMDADGSFAFSPVAVAVLDPQYVGLAQSYPNPVSLGSSTVVPYSLAVPATVDMVVYNMLGEKVATLLSNEAVDAGRYLTNWNGLSDNGTSAGAGTYLIRFIARVHGGDAVTQTQRISIIR